ncbi:MAG TPA: hypothetical protein VFG39_01630 [Balneolaceae bacterium]|nr:hypothetical protein [Balneolaceae bacterium]
MSLPEPKALAVAEEWNGGYAYGYGYRAQNLQEAKERAMLECKTRRQLYQLETECKIYMINDEIVQEK